jgi:hypothetical protein
MFLRGEQFECVQVDTDAVADPVRPCLHVEGDEGTTYFALYAVGHLDLLQLGGS